MGYTTYLRHGYHFWAERICERFEHPRLQIEVPQIIIHKADQPDVVVDFFDADGLSGKDLAEIDFFLGGDSRYPASRCRDAGKVGRPPPDISCPALRVAVRC